MFFEKLIRTLTSAHTIDNVNLGGKCFLGWFVSNCVCKYIFATFVLWPTLNKFTEQIKNAFLNSIFYCKVQAKCPLNYAINTEDNYRHFPIYSVEHVHLKVKNSSTLTLLFGECLLIPVTLNNRFVFLISFLFASYFES